ncbi:MAG TPA: transglycosylase domain-containing protein [Candidatus Methylomirabilis sp.]|nr:transglycosylase domain-containing protein [Candidatus Methylomirabilis sp.]
MDPTLVRSIPAERVAGARAVVRDRVAPRALVRRLSIAGAALLVLFSAAFFEMRTSTLQAFALSRFASEIRFKLEPGRSAPLRAPDGPYDRRLGYNRRDDFLGRLEAAGYAIESEARPSTRLSGLASRGLFPIYREKSQAGLSVIDRTGRPISESRFPEHVYESFDAVPPLIAQTLLFVENRDLLDAERPHLNPAVEWPRLAKAVGFDVLSRFGRQGQVIGASTLATQIEKFRHSREGRTRSAREKFGQMVSASLRTYLGGADTLEARRQILVDYINSMPLGAAPGYGEVLGLGDGLWAWYGADFDETNRLIAGAAEAPTPEAARAYKRALSLLLSARRPYSYLTESQESLDEFTDSYLRLIARAGVIDERLRDAALAQPLEFRTPTPAPAVEWSERKGANLVRARLAGLLNVPALYDLDRLDLTAAITLDGPAQEAVTRILTSLREPATVQALGLKGYHLLERGDPARVIYSFTLYERTPRGNALRVQTDNFDQPLDINSGARLDLGSTAKLRTLITYLEIIAAIHEHYAGRGVAQLRAEVIHPRDRLTAWAVDYLAKTPGASLTAMLEASLERRYSASPGEAFATGGGLLTFHNFEREDDERIMSVREAFRHSVNLVFIRLMRDVVDHYLYEAPASLARVLEDPDDPRRQAFLSRFADREGSEFVRRFYRKYQDKTPEQALDLALAEARQNPVALTVVFRSLDPDADVDALAAVLTARLPGAVLSGPRIQQLYDKYGPAQFSLVDRGYLARVHPLELWLVDYLRRNPEADLSQVLSASAGERQTVYGWLFKTQRRHAQDKRIRSLLEVQAFLEIQRGWQRLGYPFASMTPSLGSAIGSSGDRPAALAHLMGIIVNGGLSYPTVLLERLELAAGTPYEARVQRSPSAPERLMLPEIAAVVRGALVDVVEKGTARSLAEVIHPKGAAGHIAGGKTGTGDHRYETFAPGGRLIESRVVERAATFVFLIDDRFFGTATAYVSGPKAAQYEFTSALPVRLLAILLPALSPVLDAGPTTVSTTSLTSAPR